MDVVQIECGNCGKVMAVRMAHLGSQVHCPHCRAIVEAPPHPNDAPEIRGPQIDVAATESIFAEPEGPDALFDDGKTRPLVEMPADSDREEGSDSTMAYNPADKKPNLALDRTIEEQSEQPPSKPLSWLTASSSQPLSRQALREAARETPASPAGWGKSAEAPGKSGNLAHAAGGSSWEDKKTAGDSSMNVQVGPSAAAASAARLSKPSNLPLILLIFLVPYAVIATFVILFLLNKLNNQFDPMERLPDPKPKDGGARQVAHDTPLPAKLRTTLAKPLRVGDLEVTPVKIASTDQGELVLDLKMRNLSKNVVFNPLSDAFLKYQSGSMAAGKPYTYLEGSGRKVFGGFAEWLAGPPGKEQPFDGEIGPGQEELIRITTFRQNEAEVRQLRDSKADLTWRVQLRRGLVQVRGKDVSATAVVGIQFHADDIR